MSGGVDSSVAAALLVKQGYNVTGMFAVNFDTDTRINTDDADNADASCWLVDYRDAVRVAAKLGIKLIRWDFQKEYKKLVLDYMFREYRAGRTPNPDVMCNKFVKFGVWLERAKKLGFDKLATGHYASLREEISNFKFQISKKYPISNIQYHLTQAEDKNKDQTYFLHQLSQRQLERVLFPLGDYTKPEVRKLARRFGLPTAEKEESMGICFIGEVPMEKFLRTKIKTKPGKIVFSDGRVVGEHNGLPFYTIGQRAGLEIGNWKLEIREKQNSNPLFVVGKDIQNNKLIVGYENDSLLYKKWTIVADVNWISGHSPKFPLKCKVRLRHRQPLQGGVVTRIRGLHADDADCMIRFEKPQRAVTPGQFAVFYLSGECLGGGVIV
ncbi:MAG: tRNA 2-thiouridine(34) synthase MnmA [Candidatus Magasanikbacteria bacterium]|nr:tRNA 2-thiouridine(34) synthase MnmA [Candidatus Magasanikbacteria bacterium]